MLQLGSINATLTLEGSSYLNSLGDIGAETEAVMAKIQAAFTNVLGPEGACLLFSDATNAANAYYQALSNIKDIAPAIAASGKFQPPAATSNSSDTGSNITGWAGLFADSIAIGQFIGALGAPGSKMAMLSGVLGRAIPTAAAAYVVGDMGAKIINANPVPFGKAAEWATGGGSVDAKIDKVNANAVQSNIKRENELKQRIADLEKAGKLTKDQADSYRNQIPGNLEGVYAATSKKYLNLINPAEETVIERIARINADLKSYRENKKYDEYSLSKEQGKALSSDHKIDLNEQQNINKLEIGQIEGRIRLLKSLIDRGAGEDAQGAFIREQDNLKRKYAEQERIESKLESSNANKEERRLVENSNSSGFSQAKRGGANDSLTDKMSKSDNKTLSTLEQTKSYVRELLDFIKQHSSIEGPLVLSD